MLCFAPQNDNIWKNWYVVQDIKSTYCTNCNVVKTELKKKDPSLLYGVEVAQWLVTAFPQGCCGYCK